jgi:CRP/FNR family cyclic AMP-dependent transcriptional regulator
MSSKEFEADVHFLTFGNLLRGVVTMPIVEADVLRNIPLFELLDDNEVKALAEQLDEARYLAGQIIFHAGDTGGTMFVIKSGRVELYIDDTSNNRVSLATMDAGNLFGELSLLDNEFRSATAKAVENTELIVIDRNDLQLLVAAHPAAALDMITMLGKRIREANKLVSERVARNVNDEVQVSTNFGQKLSDVLTAIAGDIRFVYFSFIWFFVWILLNIGVIPGIEPFDKYPFGFLTLVVSLEAIFLSLFILISQNRQAQRDKIRNDIEYEVNLKAELEIRELQRQIETLQQLMLQHLSSMTGFNGAQQVQAGKNDAK